MVACGLPSKDGLQTNNLTFNCPMANKKTKTTRNDRSDCPVACTLDLIGDKWTLLLVRDLLLGKSRYNEFTDSAESIPTNILADRLKRLLEAKVIERTAYQNNPIRYEYKLTPKGKELGPIVLGYVRWGEKHIAGTRAGKKFNRRLLE